MELISVQGHEFLCINSNMGIQGQEERSKVTRQRQCWGGGEDALPRGLVLFRDLQVKSTVIK